MTIKKENVLHWFGLNEGSGDKTLDEATSTLYDIVIGARAYWESPGFVGDSMVGTNKDAFDFNYFVQIGNNFKPFPVDADWSFSVYLLSLDNHNDDAGWPVSRYRAEDGKREFRLSVRAESDPAGRGTAFNLQVLDSGNVQRSVSVDAPGDEALTGQVVQVSWQSTEGILTLFVNGTQRDQQTADGTGPYTLLVSEDNEFSLLQPSAFSGARAFFGSADQFAVFDYAISEEDAAALYNGGDGRSYENLEPPPTEEEVFTASYEDASGRDPFASALLQRTPARKLANHYVSIYKYPPYLVTKRVPIALEDYALTKPGKMIWHKDANSALFSMGRWAQIQGRRFTDNPVEIELTLRISDHAESFEAPS